jgi:hypothetical protein
VQSVDSLRCWFDSVTEPLGFRVIVHATRVADSSDRYGGLQTSWRTVRVWQTDAERRRQRDVTVAREWLLRKATRRRTTDHPRAMSIHARLHRLYYCACYIIMDYYACMQLTLFHNALRPLVIANYGIGASRYTHEAQS